MPDDGSVTVEDYVASWREAVENEPVTTRALRTWVLAAKDDDSSPGRSQVQAGVQAAVDNLEDALGRGVATGELAEDLAVEGVVADLVSVELGRGLTVIDLPVSPSQPHVRGGGGGGGGLSLLA